VHIGAYQFNDVSFTPSGLPLLNADADENVKLMDVALDTFQVLRF
jgi:hypothetical protein